MGTRSFPDVKRPERSVNRTEFIAEVKEELSYNFTTVWAFMACIRLNFSV
jgi:hypothetical protein